MAKSVQAKIHREAKKLKRKKSHAHLTWRELHGVAKCIVTGVCRKGKRKK
jgi:hypothetical protein